MATISGIPVDPITGEPKDERGLLALQKQEEERLLHTFIDIAQNVNSIITKLFMMSSLKTIQMLLE